MQIRPTRSAQQVRDAAGLMLALVRSNQDLYQDQAQMIADYYRGSWFLADEPEIPAIYQPPHGEVLIAYIGQTPVGTVSTCRINDAFCELKSVFVPAAYRGRGVAAALCYNILDVARDQHYAGVRLSTGARQPQARALYRKLGFTLVPPWEPAPEDGVGYFELRF